MPYTGPTARPLGVAVLVIAVLDELPEVGWVPSKIVHQADPSGFLKLPTWRMPFIMKVP
jgi:hypothetical protein